MAEDEEKRALWVTRGKVVDAAEARQWEKLTVNGDEYGGTAYKWDMQAREMDEATCRRVLEVLQQL